jgi:hypothetical protein
MRDDEDRIVRAGCGRRIVRSLEILTRRLLAIAVGAVLPGVPSCSNDVDHGLDRVAVTTSLADTPYEVEVKLFRLPGGPRDLNHFTYSLEMGKDGSLYFGVGDNRDNGHLLRYDPATERIADLGDFRSAMPPGIRDRGNHGKVHVGPHQTNDGSVYVASFPREHWEGEQAGRLFRYRESEGIVDLGPTPNDQGAYFMHGDDVHGRLYLATRNSHFVVYDIGSGSWEDKGRFSSKPPFIGLTDLLGRLYVYGYDGEGDFVPGPSTITRFDPRSGVLQTSKNAPPTLWVGAVTPDHVTAFTTGYRTAELVSWQFADWPDFRAVHHGRIDPEGRAIDSNNLSVARDGTLLVLAGTIEAEESGRRENTHGVWVYEIGSGRRYFAANLADALTDSFGRSAGELRIYWTNADTRDRDGWIYVGIHTFSGANPQARLLALRIHPKERDGTGLGGGG